MTDEELIARMKVLTADCLGIVDASRLAPDVRLAEDAGATSLDLLQLVVELENEFGISIDEASYETIRTFGDAVACVKQYVAEGERHA